LSASYWPAGCCVAAPGCGCVAAPAGGWVDRGGRLVLVGRGGRLVDACSSGLGVDPLLGRDLRRAAKVLDERSQVRCAEKIVQALLGLLRARLTRTALRGGSGSGSGSGSGGWGVDSLHRTGSG